MWKPSLLTFTFAVELAYTAPTNGEFTALSYNVAGLPQILQGNEVPGDKTDNSRQIGRYFAQYGYDIINMQEDFNYHAAIYETDDHPFRTATSGGVPFGSGMNTISTKDWIDFVRVKWDVCSNASGADCLTPKGFTFMRWNPSEGVYIDVYNLHADAGGEQEDLQARQSNIQQLADYISTWSAGNAVIVLGDTNSRYTRSEDTAIRTGFLTQNGLSDPWLQLHKNNQPPSPGSEALLCENPSTTTTCEIVDKLFYRGSKIVNLQASGFRYDGENFLNTKSPNVGAVLSDHNPILTNFSWSLSPSLRQSAFSGGPHGAWFNDLPSLPPNPKTSKIIFRGANRLDSVGVQLTDGTLLSHGGEGGSEVELSLEEGEVWVETELCTGQRDGRTRNFYIQATTSRGRSLQAGTRTEECVRFEAEEGWGVVGFVGRAGEEVDLLGVVYGVVR